MDNNLKIILGKFEKYKGQFVIVSDNKIERLIAIGQDEWDYYYVTYDGRDIHWHIHWHTCAGSIMPLKGYLRDKDYNELVRIAKLNHYDQVDFEINGNMNEFLKAFQKEIETYSEDTKFLTERCWDLKEITIKDIRKRKIKEIGKISR